MKAGVTILMTILFVSCVEIPRLSDPNCRCYIFSKNQNTSGIFKSPLFPHTYPSDLNCFLYRFEADSTEIVRIVFSTFRLSKPENKRCSDHVDLYTTVFTHSNQFTESLHQRWSLVSPGGKRPADFRLCGDLVDLPQTDFYSVGSVLFLVFHTVPLANRPKKLLSGGFYGHYTFEPRASYKTDGILKQGSICSYRFSDAGGPFPQRAKGRFFSPLYPSNYVANLHCTYHFSCLPTERIVLTFHSIKLNLPLHNLHGQAVFKCSTHAMDMSQQDSLTVTEPDTNGSSQMLAQICGHVNDIQIVSHGTSLVVDLVTHPTPYQGQGFRATYEFVQASHVLPSPYILPELKEDVLFQDQSQPRSGEHTYQIAQQELPHDNAGTSSANEHYTIAQTSEDAHLPHMPARGALFVRSTWQGASKRGSIYSPDYPKASPAMAESMINFIGMPKEVVEIELSGSHLRPSDKCLNLQPLIYDYLELFDGQNTNDRRLAVLCRGDNTLVVENRLTKLIFTSSTQYLTLRFRTDALPDQRRRGFVIKYQFRKASSDLVGAVRETASAASHVAHSPAKMSTDSPFMLVRTLVLSAIIWILPSRLIIDQLVHW